MFSAVKTLILFFLIEQVTIVGYNHKLRILLDTIVDKIVKFEVRPDRFAITKVNESPLLYLDVLSF